MDQEAKPQRWSRSDWACMALLAVVIVAHGLPALNRKISRNDDWRRLAVLNAAARRTLLEFRTFPLRSPYLGGGYPTIAEPEDPTLSPFFVLTLLLGEAYGLKLRALLCVLAGGTGVFVLCRRRLAFTRVASLAAAGVLVFASWFPARQLGGNVTEMQFAFAPWLMVLLLQRTPSSAARAGAAVLLAVAAIDGKFVWATMVLYLVLVSFMWAKAVGDTAKQALRAPGRVFGIAALSLALAAVRLLPAAVLMHGRGNMAKPGLYPHKPGYTAKSIGGYSLRKLGESLVDTAWGTGGSRANRLTIGAIALAVAGLGLVVALKHLWWLLVPGAICVWLMCAHHVWLDLFWLLHQLPPFHLMTFPNKYFDFFALLTLAVLCGALVDHLPQRLGPTAGRTVGVLLLAAMLAEPCHESAQIVAGTFDASIALVRKPGPFFQVHSLFERPDRRRQPGSDTYLNLLAGVGTIDWFTPVPIETRVQAKVLVQRDGSDLENPAYRGEASAAPKGSRAWLVIHEPNRLVVQADLTGPGVVVVNQNYSRWWTCAQGEVLNRNGLLAVAAREGGRPTFELRYLPWDFVWGLVVSAFTALGLAAWVWHKHPERLK